MKKPIVCAFMAGMTGILNAAIINWQSPQPITGTADVLTNGVYFGSWAPDDPGAASLPVNGVAFQDSDLPGLSYNFFGGVSSSSGLGSPGTSDPNYNSLLEHAFYAYKQQPDGHVGATFSWGGMTPGHTYEIQFWANAPGNSANAPSEYLIGGDLTYGGNDYSSLLNLSYPVVGSYIVGTFVADSSGSQEILLDAYYAGGIGGGGFAMVNLFQVRDITIPRVYGSVLQDAPLAYYRLNEPGAWRPDVATNSGSLGAVDNGANYPGAGHQAPGAIVGDPDTAMHYSAIDTSSDDGGVPTIIPYDSRLNPDGSFTVEAWLRPTEEGAANAQCPLFNSQASTEDWGWDLYQRASVAGSGQKGWEFYMNNSSGGRAADLAGGSYTVGQWCHLAMVYNAAATTATLYENGVQVAQATGVFIGSVVNPSFPMSIGGYSDGSQNPYVGDIDEFAVYGSALSAAQLLAHYQNGTNVSRSVSYNSLIQSDGALEYLRLDEPAVNVAVNSGTLGPSANGVDSDTGTPVAGPKPPQFPGLEAANLALSFNGSDYVELSNPSGLNFTGPITLEAWIKPETSQNSPSYIVTHGVNDTNTAGVALYLNGASSYVIASTENTSFEGVSAPIPAGDLGTSNWVYLVGTYDGADWNLYRNGVLIGSSPNSIGAVQVNNANWAIGARGRWKRDTIGVLNDQFNGVIDEAAIYNHALSASRVQAHYAESIQPFALSTSGGQLTLTWPQGTLVESTNVAGPWAPVLTNGISPYHPSTNSSAQFFRIRY